MSLVESARRYFPPPFRLASPLDRRLPSFHAFFGRSSLSSLKHLHPGRRSQFRLRLRVYPPTYFLTLIQGSSSRALLLVCLL